MKNKLILNLFLIVVGGMIMAGLTGCDNNDTQASEKGKYLTITGLKASPHSGKSLNLALFPPGTSIQDAQKGKGLVASITVSAIDNDTVPLASNGSQWTGTGTYDVFFVIDKDGSPSVYQKKSVTITEENTVIPFSDFTSVSL
jgi:hypothetical protein